MFALIRTFTELSGAAPDGSCMTIDGTTHPTQRSVVGGGGQGTNYKYYKNCPFANLPTCPAGMYPVEPSMECGVEGAVVPGIGNEAAEYRYM